MPNTTPAYPAQLLVRTPKGWPARLKRIARRREQSVSEYLRGILREAMAAAEAAEAKSKNGQVAPR